MELIERVKFNDFNIKKIKSWVGRLCLIVSNKNKDAAYIGEIDKLLQGRLERSLASDEFERLHYGESIFLSYPVGLKSTELQIVKIEINSTVQQCRLVGGTIASSSNKGSIMLIAAPDENTVEVLYGFFLKAYKFDYLKSKPLETIQNLIVMDFKFDLLQVKFKFFKSLLNGVYFCRDLTNEPGNILNTIEFARRLKLLEDHGLSVEVLEEEQLHSLGMRALLAVGQGSECPSKVVVIKWQGGKEEEPLLLVGKGVVFDSGGISIKASGGMEEMVMDMGGAAVVSGTMKTLALRQSAANVIGLIGLVENMPDGKAQRPGDVVKSMKGDTIEVINTDAEGRLVLCDLLWYGQTHFSPKVIIDLATLTGAVIIALGHQNAGVFSNNDGLCEKFLKSASLEGEGAWRLPLHPNFQKLLKSRVADIANVGGRAAGASVAAEFLQTFVESELPWIHIDIAGVAFSKGSSKLSSQGATGWGVASLNRLIYDHYENKL